jgi:glyoxylase-like metal-dependent hydrolase (beta-lactamase superfamily II)
MTQPLISVHEHDADTFILRQSKAVHYEAPFLYLFRGRDRALLLDTGATEDHERFPLRATVDGLIGDQELIVAHTHGHDDHVAGDPQFADRARTTVVPRDVDAVRSYFGFTDWPTEIVTFDLGGRTLEIFGIPGHQKASIAVYDPSSGFLVTGDTVCRGRLYVFDYPAFQDSMERLVTFAADRPVTQVMGCHIEMTTTPGVDYPIGTTYQPDEPELPMTVAHLREIRDAAASVVGAPATAEQPAISVYDDFIIYHVIVS